MSEYKSIDELMEGKAPGSVKVQFLNWPETLYFVPYFKDLENKGRWHGQNYSSVSSGRADWFEGDAGEWKLYEEPKKPVVRWLWAYRSGACTEWLEASSFYTEDEAARCLGAKSSKIKLDFSRTEFPE